MGVFKILGGVALGVGAIAAAPFTGGGSIIGAGIAGGVIASKIDEEEERKKKKSEKREAKLKRESAERVKREQKLRENLRAQEFKFKEQKEFEEYVTAMFAVALSAANSDGEIHPNEIRDLEEFIAGESYKAIPKSLKYSIERLKNKPPNFNTAMQYVKEVSRSKWNIFDDIISIVILADGVVKPEEIAFEKAWKEYKKTA